MLRRLNIALGENVVIEGRTFVFTGEVIHEGASSGDEKALGFRNLTTGACVTLGAERFQQLYGDGQVRILKRYEAPRDRPGPQVEESELARWRRLWCEAFDAAPSARSDVALRAFITAHAEAIVSSRAPPSPGALRVWLRERGMSGDRRARFMGDRRGAPARLLRIEPAAARVLEAQAEAFYDGVRINPEAVYCATRTAIEEINVGRARDGVPPVRAPSLSTVRRYLRRHLDYGRALRRYGWREGARRFTPIRGSLEARHVLDVAVVDQTLVDCVVVDDEHLINIGRPWLAVMIDVRSRYPLGFSLSFEPPSVQTVLGCLRHAVRPKLELAEAHREVEGEWPAFGVPDTLVVDNAWENTGSSLRDACADAGISLHFAPIATPEYKGVCERFFGVLNTLLFHRMAGGLPFTPQQRTKLGIDNDADAALLLSDVRRAIHQCIVEVYGRRFHKALQAAPEAVWRKDAALHGRPYVADLAALDLALAKLVPGERTLSRTGLTLNDLTYNTPEALGPLLADLLPRQAPRAARTGTAKVKVKHHPDDLGQVFVWNPVRSTYVVLACTQDDYARGLSEHHHQLIRSYARAEHLAFQSEAERCRAKVRLQELVMPVIPLGRLKTRQAAARLKATPAAGPVAVTPPADAIPLAALGHRRDEGLAHRAPRKTSKRVKRPDPAAVAALRGMAPAEIAMPSPFADAFEPASARTGASSFAEFFSSGEAS